MLRAALILSFLALLPGCVVWEIRDEMRGVNTRLDAVDNSLTEVNDELTDIEVQLGDVYAGRMDGIWPEVRDALRAEAAALPSTSPALKNQFARLRSRANEAEREAQTLFAGFLQRLKDYRVLDPACGSGNFLYLALKCLKDLEHQVNLEAEALGLQTLGKLARSIGAD